VRTSGALELGSTTRLLTRIPAALQDAALGLTLVHPLCSSAQVPLAWPSSIRQQVRNDYPFLACLELGAVAVRTPWTDLADTLQGRRLRLLRQEGVRVQAFIPFSEELDLCRLLDHHLGAADQWELQIPGSSWPPGACLDLLREARRHPPLSLSAIVPGQRLPGKQHPRTRLGYLPDELAGLDRLLEKAALSLDSVLCRIDGPAGPWQTILSLTDSASLPCLGRIDWLLTLPGLDDHLNARLAAEALFACALFPGSRLFVDPLIDLDRTLDVRSGLLDTLCNPRPAFHVLRCLNTLLHHYRSEPFKPGGLELENLRVLRLLSPRLALSLLLPGESECALPEGLGTAGSRLYHLLQGTVETPADPGRLCIRGPVLMVASR
jgi:hypothetical protein